MFEYDDRFQKLCLQAAIACGDDMAAIERFVVERIATLDEESQRAVRRDMERLLGFQAPDRPTSKPH